MSSFLTAILELVKFTYRLAYHIGLFLFVLLPLEILGWAILLPVTIIQHLKIEAQKERQTVKPDAVVDYPALPDCLKWFDNADQYIGRDTSTYDAVYRAGWWSRYYWLAFRNPLNYFGYVVLGAHLSANDQIFSKIVGDYRVGTNSTAGYYHCELADGKLRIYEYNFVHKWSATKCFQLRFGWKIADPAGDVFGSWIQIVGQLKPYCTYTGS